MLSNEQSLFSSKPIDVDFITPIKLELHKVPNELVRIEENWGQGCQKWKNK